MTPLSPSPKHTCTQSSPCTSDTSGSCYSLNTSGFPVSALSFAWNVPARCSSRSPASCHSFLLDRLLLCPQSPQQPKHPFTGTLLPSPPLPSPHSFELGPRLHSVLPAVLAAVCVLPDPAGLRAPGRQGLGLTPSYVPSFNCRIGTRKPSVTVQWPAMTGMSLFPLLG